MPQHRVLIVDDEESVRFGVRAFFEARGYAVVEATTCAEAEQALLDPALDAAVVDYLLPDGTAVELLPRLKQAGVRVPIVILTGHGTIELAVRAIKAGAEQFLTKPVELPSLLVIIERLLEKGRLERRERAGRPRGDRPALDPFLGTSPAIRTLSEHAHKVVTAESPVLIQGETGTGKGILAAWLHRHGPRSEEPWVDLNCAGLAREFLETELFGHEKGAFTGASSSKAGLFEVAHRGTVFLDEIGDMDPTVQATLLKVLEDKSFRRLGSLRNRSVDVRLLTATHQDLATLIRERRFREDLYYRISTVILRVPPLRNRLEDLVLLVRRILDDLSAELGRPGLSLSAEAFQALQAHPWPGNVRELRNVLERAALLGEGSLLRLEDLCLVAPPGAPAADGGRDQTLLEIERRHIERVLVEEGGRVEQAARRLGIPRSSLYQKIKALQITLPR